MKTFNPIVIKGQQFDSLDSIAKAIIAGYIKLSDLPFVHAATTPKEKVAIPTPSRIHPLSLPTKEEVGNRILRATLTHKGECISYRFTPRWPYVPVPPDIFDLPLSQQKSIVRNALNKIRPLWQEERNLKAAEFYLIDSFVWSKNLCCSSGWI